MSLTELSVRYFAILVILCALVMFLHGILTDAVTLYRIIGLLVCAGGIGYNVAAIQTSK